MSGLQPAHRGYEYQDLMAATRSVDLLLGNLRLFIVDEKLVDDDRFDDLTTVDADGRRERVQIKHKDRDEQPLSPATFTSTSDSRQLRFDKLLTCAVADRAESGGAASQLTYRIVMRDSRPTDQSLNRVLKLATPDPRSMLAELPSVRLQFDVDELWPVHVSDGHTAQHTSSLFSFLRNVPNVTRDDVIWFCRNLVVEVESPAMSGDFGNPGAAEQLLIDRVVRDIGAGLCFNTARSPNDVCEALVKAMRMARQGRIQLSRSELLRRISLESNFGSTAYHNPVNPEYEVTRITEVEQIASLASQVSKDGGAIALEGPPGQGKSWACKQLVDFLSKHGWLVAEHYCYLGAADTERELRVHTDHMFGTILDLLQESDPSITTGLRPRFAASPQAVRQAVEVSLATHPHRPVAIVVDGLDHVSRIAPLSRFQDPSRSVVQELSALTLPPGSVLIVLSQPGDHLAPLIDVGAEVYEIKGLSTIEVAALAGRHGISLDLPAQEAPSASLAELIHRRSRGNALYSTYLCREIQRRDSDADILTSIEAIPEYDGSLSQYYQFLHDTLGDRAAWVSEYLAFLDFAVTPSELAQIQPDRSSHVRSALTVLGPVLNAEEQGGYRIYHESFSRFLADRLDEEMVIAINDRISKWLLKDGLYADDRAYRFAVSTLAKAMHYSTVVDLIDPTFVAKSVGAGYPASEIRRNLSIAADCAVRDDNWPAVVRFVEVARSASEYEYERFDAVLVEYADIPITVIGGDEFTSRLIFDDHPVVSGRMGLLLCSALDEQGIAVPWEPYIDAFIKDDATDNTSYGAESDAKVYLAILRGRLRRSSVENASPDDVAHSKNDDSLSWLEENDRFQRLVEYIDDSGLPIDQVAKVVLKTLGPAVALKIASRIHTPGPFALAAVERMWNSDRRELPEAKKFRSLALRFNGSNRNVRALLDLNVSLDDLISGTQEERRERLLNLTTAMQQGRDRDEATPEWLDLCLIAALDDPIGLSAAEAAIRGESWYRYWLRFCIRLASAEASSRPEQSSTALSAIRLLNVRTLPFEGDPRTVDLYGIWEHISETIHRAANLLDDDDWQTGLGVLQEMSSAICISIRGEFSGPFASDDLLKLIVATTGTSTERYAFAVNTMKAIADANSNRRHYSDMAVYRLLVARLAIRFDDLDDAERLWVEACQFLGGYGFHKDRTIYEVLSPLSVLARVRPALGRRRLAITQQLSIRVVAHTDGKETRHAVPAWWRLLANADPCALARMVSESMLGECNLPNGILDDARTALWEAWQAAVDPVLASLLRCTLDCQLHDDDIVGLKRLLGIKGRPDAIDAQVVSLADERPSRYSYSSNVEMLERDLERIDELNAISNRMGAPEVASWTQYDALLPTAASGTHWPPDVDIPHTHPFLPPVDTYLPGSPGLAQAIRAWQGFSVDATRSAGVTRFANAIGYRLVELVQQGRESDVRFAIRSIAEADEYRSRHTLLALLADGLARSGCRHLAATALAFHWTRSRGGGGLLNFGGETNLDSLRRAVQLDQTATMEVVSEETQKAIRGWNIGVTQALILAFALVEMPAPDGELSIDVALRCWDEAAAIIAYRTPKVHSWDEPLQPYSAPEPDSGDAYIGDVDSAFAIATIAGVSHPGRERKRRSLVSLRMLLEYAPSVAGHALGQCLPQLRDPATLVWILKLVELASNRETIVEHCQSSLLDLSVSDHLSVRSLARRLLVSESALSLPATPPDNALLDTGHNSVELWLPPNTESTSRSVFSDAISARLEAIGGSRIKQGEALLPQLGRAALDRFDRETGTEAFHDRIDSQANGRGRGDWWPDAYTAIEEAAETALQRSAGGGRLAMLANGAGLLGEEWEQQLADAIIDDPSTPLDLEATRYPRPAIPIAPGKSARDWYELANQLDGSNDCCRFDHVYRIDRAGPPFVLQLNAGR